jgi:excisionase family DNA binding protein
MSTPRPLSPLFTIDEAAIYLRISRSQIYRFMKGGELTYVSLASKKRVLERSELDAFIANRRVK